MVQESPDEIDSVVDVQLAVRAQQVGLDRANAYSELRSDLRRRMPAPDCDGNLALAVAEDRELRGDGMAARSV